MMPDELLKISRIGLCELPVGPPHEEPRGYWLEATCREYQQALGDAGGLPEMHVWSSLTDMDGSRTGTPFVFTCWGQDDNPVAASGGPPGAHYPCVAQHAVFFAFTNEQAAISLTSAKEAAGQ